MTMVRWRVAGVALLALGVCPGLAVGQVINFGPMDGEKRPACVVSRGADQSFYLVDLKHETTQKVGPRGRLVSATAEEAFSAGQTVSGDRDWVVTGDGKGGIFFAGGCSEFSAGGGGCSPLRHWKDTGRISVREAEDRFSPWAVARGSTGIFASGQSTDNPDHTPRWQVRRWDEEGQAWRIVDALSGPLESEATAVHVAPDGSVFVAGVIEKKWIVRRSLDQGRTWKQVDAFQLVDGQHSVPCGVATAALGNLHVVGYAEVAPDAPESVHLADDSHWIVRSSRDGGEHFQTTENLTSPQKKGESRADAVTILPNGDVVVIGTVGYPDRRQIRVLKAKAKRWVSVGSRYVAPPEHRYGVTSGESGTFFSLGNNVRKENECWLEGHRVPR